MKKCAANENHFYSDHLTHCPWCELKKDTGKDHFPGLQMTMTAPITIVSRPVPKSAPLKTYIPPLRKTTYAPRGFYKVATFFALVIVIFLIFTAFDNNQEITIPSVSSSLKPSADQKTFTNSIGMEFVLIPAGEFKMGTPSNDRLRNGNEDPIHRVKISNAFYMGKYEVTQKQWREVMGNNPSNFKGDNLPVEMVSWNDVQDFIKKLNEKEGGNKYRLPSEAEWEYAARAGTTTSYSFGDGESMLSDYAWYPENSGSRPPEKGDFSGYNKKDFSDNKWNGRTHSVGQKKPNPWGLYDIHGNVYEWVQDEWHDDYNGAPTDGSSWKSGDGPLRVFRGGSWKWFAWYCRSVSRGGYMPDNNFNDLGFRLLRIL
jgi:formylglycine-generating enzyme required for sulfatase activity